ncbi:hypothetical protein PQR62_05375 [Herbaspirillum lusitanum]|uniref:Lipoprotein n=1 Tax=Herbaspirillum lusitanum TaxID=213312 RepID=A0ABW9A492_9BURK
MKKSGTILRCLIASFAVMALGGCVAVPYDPYYSPQAVYYPVQPVYTPYYSSFYFGYGGGWGGGRGHWRH